MAFVCSLQLAVGGLGLRFGLVCRLDVWFLIGDCMVVILTVWWVFDVYFMVGCWCVCVLLGLL